MSEPKVTRENEHLEWLNDRLKEEYDRHSRHYHAIKNALIEHGPEVDEETLESLLGERSLYGIIRYLRQKGVTVKEAQNQNEIYQDEGPGLQEEGDK